MSETPSSPQTEVETPSAPFHEPSPAPSITPKPAKTHSQAGKKVSAEILERRRAGRAKAAELMAKKIKKSGILRRDNPLKYSVFENINLINQKNYFTDYLKKDEQFFILRERKQIRINKPSQKEKSTKLETPRLNQDIDEEDEDDDDDNDNNENQIDDRSGNSTIVIHPGSRNIRIGFASDVYPKTIPFVFAIPANSDVNTKTERTLDQIEQSVYDDNKALLVRDFKERMKYYKRRIIPNSNEVVQNFNKKVQPEKIAEHNDVHRFEFIKPDSDPSKRAKYYIGDDVFNLDSTDYKLRYPLITNGKFNESEYKSRQELIGDIQLFISKTLETQFEVTNLKQYKISLVIPDLYDKLYVQTFVELLLKMGFQGVAILQESIAATYGAGVSSACVVDMGAKTTKISCIDDGLIIPNSRAVLNYGGDDVTRFFHKLLKESSFPVDFDESKPYEWKMLEQLKEKFLTFQDANITVQLYNTIKRYPDKLSEKFEFKVFDEVILAPMALFFPKVFEKEKSFTETPINNTRSYDVFTGDIDDPISSTQKNLKENDLYADQTDFAVLKDLINSESLDQGDDSNSRIIAALDKAIIQSIAISSRYDFTKAKAFYENLLIVGGGSKIESLSFILTDRINIWRPKILALLQLIDFLKKIEQITTEFEKENEFAKLTTEEELQPLKDQLFQIIERELAIFLDSSSNTILNVEVLPAPREIDPSILTWKGGSVFARLKIVGELFITEKDWDLLGSRALQHKALFSY